MTVRPDDAIAAQRLMAALEAALAGAGPPVAPAPPNGRAVPPGDLIFARDDTAAVIVTSGSTSRPKAVELSAAALTAGARATHYRLGGAGRWILALPVSGVAGLQVLTRSLLAGTEPVVVPPSMHDGTAFADAAEAIAGHGGPLYTALVPTQLFRLLSDRRGREALAALDAVLLGGAAADPHLLESAQRAGVSLVCTYGMTETCGGCVYDGVPLDAVGVALGLDGRIRIAGPVLFSGYFRQEQLTAAVLDRGWFATADLGRFDDDGLLHVVGRIDDVVIVGGTNVVLPEVTARLSTHPDVRDAWCVGLDDAEWGQVVAAAVVVAGEVSDEDLGEWLRTGGLPREAVPRRVLRVDALPQLPNGKHDRRAIAALLASG